MRNRFRTWILLKLKTSSSLLPIHVIEVSVLPSSNKSVVPTSFVGSPTQATPKSPFIFVSERGGPFTTDSFNWMVKRAGQKAGLPFQVHAHMLRHATGYKLAGDGHDTRSIQDYLGHKNIQHTVRYTELSPTRFKDFWRD